MEGGGSGVEGMTPPVEAEAGAGNEGQEGAGGRGKQQGGTLGDVDGVEASWLENLEDFMDQICVEELEGSMIRRI